MNISSIWGGGRCRYFYLIEIGQSQTSPMPTPRIDLNDKFKLEVTSEMSSLCISRDDKESFGF